MNWLVCWFVAISVNAECPDFKPDPYTGEMPNAHCAVYHGKTEKIAKTKWFDTKIEANDFISKAPQEIKKRMKLIDATEEPEGEAAPVNSGYSDFYKGMKLLNSPGVKW